MVIVGMAANMDTSLTCTNAPTVNSLLANYLLGRNVCLLYSKQRYVTDQHKRDCSYIFLRRNSPATRARGLAMCLESGQIPHLTCMFAECVVGDCLPANKSLLANIVGPLK